MTIMVAEAGLSPREYSPILQVGVVSGQSDNKRFMVVVGREEISAMLAVSCLVKPEEGDTVAVYNVEGMGYVLGLVLERASSGCVDITIDGEVRIESTGALSLKSLEEVSISAKGKIEMLSERFEVFSEELKVRGKRLISTFESVNLSGDSVLTYFNKVTSTAVTVMQSAQKLFRNTKTVESVQCGALSQKVSGALVSQSEYTALLSKQDMRIDGARIHVG
ncbi:MAG: DUF3540 domain-containing protein [Proteobacteria bacterium TMED51]|jgi:hypothetical protein|nr:MAG: DUF3540 domain-containing protein [Proteobacteria bacterium TMED51]|tara:strand:+ start:376 stop:1038 length:663 start_codon:yes stop_codon:yes gene_type:complete